MCEEGGLRLSGLRQERRESSEARRREGAVGGRQQNSGTDLYREAVIKTITLGLWRPRAPDLFGEEGRAERMGHFGVLVAGIGRRRWRQQGWAALGFTQERGRWVGWGS